MDGVLADFDGAITSGIEVDPPEMFVPGFFRGLKVHEGAKEAVPKIMSDKRYEVFIGSKTTSKNTLCATEKMDWIQEHFPALKKRMVLVCDKKLLRGDILIDDDFERWSKKFVGQFIHFDKFNPKQSWANVLEVLDIIKKKA